MKKKEKGERVEKTEIVVQFTLDTDVHKTLKARAALAGKTLRDFIRE
jgi:hypothetical protein